MTHPTQFLCLATWLIHPRVYYKKQHDSSTDKVTYDSAAYVNLSTSLVQNNNMTHPTQFLCLATWLILRNFYFYQCRLVYVWKDLRWSKKKIYSWPYKDMSLSFGRTRIWDYCLAAQGYETIVPRSKLHYFINNIILYVYLMFLLLEYVYFMQYFENM